MGKKKKTLIDTLIESGTSELTTETKPIIDLSETKDASEKQQQQQQTASRWVTSVSVPQDAEILLREIDFKLAKLKVKSLKLGMRWYVGLVLFNKLLDYVDKDEFDPKEGICNYLLNKIEKEFPPPSSEK